MQLEASDLVDLTAWRRALHRVPELSGQEAGTAERVRAVLAGTGPEALFTGLGGHGVAAVYAGGGAGPTVMIRAELDALPIEESNTFAHRSTTRGVSHKCGHDGHMATLVAVGDGMREKPPERGRVYLLFQPAEETGTGASAVIEDERFRALTPPDFVYAFHNVPRYPHGRVLVRNGLFAQASVGFIVRFHGKTSHSSYPEHGVNPSRAVTALVNTVNSFDTAMADRVGAPVLGTISYAELGVAEKGPNFGTSPGEATVMGVVRAHRTEDLKLLRAHLAEVAGQLAADSALTHELDWYEAFAATESDSECVDVIERAARDAGLAVERLDEPFRWSEDFGYFTSAFTGAFFGLGSGVDQPQLHDDGYDYPDELIGIGARLYRGIIDQHLGRQ
jgi:amidohydrolase